MIYAYSIPPAAPFRTPALRALRPRKSMQHETSSVEVLYHSDTKQVKMREGMSVELRDLRELRAVMLRGSRRGSPKNSLVVAPRDAFG